MKHTTITFTCDRCGLEDKRPADRNIADEALPDGWSSVKLESTDELPYERFEVCGPCRKALAKGFTGRSGFVGVAE